MVITMVYGGPIGGFGGFCGAGGRFSMFLYKIIVIKTRLFLALIFFLSFLYDLFVGVYLMHQWFSTVIDCSTARGMDTPFKTVITIYIRVLFYVTVSGSF